jgi:hypothetical protein
VKAFPLCIGFVLIWGCTPQASVTQVAVTQSGYVVGASEKPIPLWDHVSLKRELTMSLDYPRPDVALRGAEELSLAQFISLLEVVSDAYVQSFVWHLRDGERTLPVRVTLPLSDAFVCDVDIRIVSHRVGVGADCRRSVKTSHLGSNQNQPP